MPAKLILLRHGQSQWNLENRFTGFQDVDLSEKGRHEATASGLKIKDSGIVIDVVFTSTLKRAYLTAIICLKEAGIELPQIKSSALNERDYGDLTGLNKDETKAKYGDEQVHIWRRSYDTRPPGGESLKDVVERVAPYFEAHIKPLLVSGQTVLIAAHGNSLRALMVVLGQYTPETIHSFEIPTGSPLVIEFEGQDVKSYAYL